MENETKMTGDEVCKMTAGKELDALVARDDSQIQIETELVSKEGKVETPPDYTLQIRPDDIKAPVIIGLDGSSLHTQGLSQLVLEPIIREKRPPWLSK